MPRRTRTPRWTKKNDESFYGYKNHLGVDKAHKLIRKWGATDAAVHDSQKLDDVLDLSNTGKEAWADSAYRSVQIEAGLEEKGLHGSWLTTPVPSKSMLVRTAATPTPRPSMISADLTRHAIRRCAGRTAADRKGCASIAEAAHQLRRFTHTTTEFNNGVQK
jgi:hypothetical protein